MSAQLRYSAKRVKTVIAQPEIAVSMTKTEQGNIRLRKKV